MTPAPGLNKAQQEAYLASVKAFQNRTRPKGPAPSGGSPVKPKGGGAMGGMGPKPIGGGPFGTKNPNGPRKPMGSPSPMAGAAGAVMNSMFKGPTGMKKGGMATKKKAGKISEYGGKEMYSSKKAMMKHEGMEGMKMEKSEGMKMRGGGMAAKGKGLAMKKGGMAPKGRGMAIMIAIGKPKGRGKS